VSQVASRLPRLTQFYHRFLLDEDSARFIRSVTDHYLLSTLTRLATAGDRTGRRAAVLALGFVGTYELNPLMGAALLDRDRGVRLIAENAIRDIWRRDGLDEHRRWLDRLIRYNGSGQFLRAAEGATELIEECPWYAEAWNQRAMAHFQLEMFEDSIHDCQQTLELNPYHFAAAVGMGQCYLELEDGLEALACFRRGLDIHPGLEAVRIQIEYLERALEER
jgi:tetratricopeptide (TPR) repeat protein